MKFWSEQHSVSIVNQFHISVSQSNYIIITITLVVVVEISVPNFHINCATYSRNTFFMLWFHFLITLNKTAIALLNYFTSVVIVRYKLTWLEHNNFKTIHFHCNNINLIIHLFKDKIRTFWIKSTLEWWRFFSSFN